MVTSFKGKQFTIVPDGFYTVKLEKWEDTETQYGHGVAGIFSIEKGKYQGKQLRCTFPAEHSSKNKLGRFIGAVLGKYDHSEDYNPEHFVGKILKITVKNEETKDGKYSRIQEFYNEEAEA